MVYEKVIGTVRKRTISALIYPAILVTMMFVLIGIIVLRVVRVLGLLRQFRSQAARVHRDRCRHIERRRDEYLADPRGRGRVVAGTLLWSGIRLSAAPSIASC